MHIPCRMMRGMTDGAVTSIGRVFYAHSVICVNISMDLTKHIIHPQWDLKMINTNCIMNYMKRKRILNN